MGTSTPSVALEVEATGENAEILVERTDGAAAIITGGNSGANFGYQTNHEVRFIVNGASRMVIDTDGDVGIGNNSPDYLLTVSTAYCNSGAWVPGSSREYKKNIINLTVDEAMKAFAELNPVKFNYKTNKNEDYMGFIAEDVPDLVATKNRKGVVPMDVVAVLTKVLQEQQKTIAELKEEIAELKNK